MRPDSLAPVLYLLVLAIIVDGGGRDCFIYEFRRRMKSGNFFSFNLCGELRLNPVPDEKLAGHGARHKFS